MGAKRELESDMINFNWSHQTDTMSVEIRPGEGEAEVCDNRGKTS